MRFKYKIKGKDGVIKEGVIVADFLEDVVLNFQKNEATEIEVVPIDEVTDNQKIENKKGEETKNRVSDNFGMKEKMEIENLDQTRRKGISRTIKCPFCAEEILVEAIKCKHCGSGVVKKMANDSVNRLASKDVLGFVIVGTIIIGVCFLYSYNLIFRTTSSKVKVVSVSHAQTMEKYYDKGVEYGAQGKFKEAKKEFKKIPEVDQLYSSAKEILKLLENVLEKRTGNEGVICLFKGIAYRRKGMPDESIAEYKRAIILKLNYALVHHNLGVAYRDKEMFDESIAECKQAIAISPNYADAYFSLGVAYDRKGMWDEAIVEYKKAIAINPNDDGAHCNLGEAYVSKGMLDEAIVEYKKAIAINPNDAIAHLNLGLVYGPKGMWDEKIAECKKAIAINPNDDMAHYILGLADLPPKKWTQRRVGVSINIGS